MLRYACCLPRRRQAPIGGDRQQRRDLAAVRKDGTDKVGIEIGHVSTVDFRHSMPECAATALASEGMSTLLGKFSPNCSSSISLARKVTTGLRISRLVASTMRITFNGAALGLRPSSRPSRSRVFRAGFIRAVVRPSGSPGAGPMSVTANPASAKPSAAINPAGPLPATKIGVFS